MAVHVLAVLAYKDGDPVTSALLASSVNTNPVIVRRLLLALQRARLVETRKGAGLGSRLSRSPARINLGDVYRAVEDHECFVMTRQKPDRACPVGQCIRGALETVFASAEEAIIRELSRTTLAHILDTIKAAYAGAPKKSQVTI